MQRSGLATLLAPVLGVLACWAWHASAHEAVTTELTWTRNVSRIVYNRCAGCHREGGSAPMPLTTYEEVRPWASAIKHVVLTRRMPPWGAVKGFGTFRNDPSLSLPEIAVISSWVEGGAPEGDAIYFEPFHVHEGTEPAAETDGGRIAVRGTVRLDRSIIATGVTPLGDVEPPWLQLTAHLPDGAVEHLLWLRGGPPAVPRDYWFLRRITLPVGTRLLCEPESASVELRFVESPGRPGS